MTTTARRCAFLLLSLLAVLVPAAPVFADQPVRVPTQVTDNAGALAGSESEVNAALSRLQSETGLQLFVVFVESFDGIPAQQWTDETASLSDLGDRDALLAVATVDRAYAYSFPEDDRLSDRELADVAADDIEPALGRNDWAGAVVAGADGYRAAMTASGSPALGGVLVVFLVVIVGAIIWVVVRRRRSAGVEPGDAKAQIEKLTTEANALLIELDDDLRQSERELAVAAGQYGTEATTTYQAALEASRADVAEAFRLRMTLDDEPKPTTETRLQTLQQIVALCKQADDRLDEKAEEFDRLRDLETRAAEVADEVDRRRATAEATLPAAEATLHEVDARFSGPPVTGISTNVTEARERLAFAAGATERARAALAGDNPAGSGPAGSGPAGSGPTGSGPGGSGPAATGRVGNAPAGSGAADSGPASTPPTGSTPAAGAPAGASDAAGGNRAEAALAVRAAEDAVDQAEQLVAAVHKTAADLDAARRSADALVLEVEAELAAGRAALAGPAAAPPTLAGAVASAEQVLTEVRAQLATPKPDPLALAARLQETDSALDQALAEARDAAERIARARSLLSQALPVARSEVSAAGAFIGTHRGVVAANARTSLSEAQRHLSLAESLAASDPVTAVAEAQQAQRLASLAGRRARNDMQSWGSGSGYGGSGMYDAGAMLGGILSGGGRGRSGGWSGGGFGGSSSRRRRTGSSSVRRSSSSRRSSGGRRGGGGRF